ncbi:IclR family transcriptional regulator [Lentzea sp. NPDC059081]|uniref:IclR family transcriptional regulator n=1 Tax=Lentzea sp. NPDC059081 TaxID=3346719 RepID=UPI0036A81336
MTAPTMLSRGGSGRILTAVEKAMVLLNELVNSSRPQSLAELTRRTGLTKSTVHRLLAVLLAHRMVERVGDQYTPGGCFNGAESRSSGDAVAQLRRESTPYLTELHYVSGHTVAVAVLADNAVQCVNQVYGHRSPRLPEWTSGSERLRSDATGRVLAAFQTGRGPSAVDLGVAEMMEIRRDGVVSIDDMARGLTSVAVPVLVSAGFALPVALTATDRTERIDVPATARLLRRTAFTLARSLRLMSITGLSRQAG